MSTPNNESLEQKPAQYNKVFDETKACIDQMENHSRITVEDLVTKVQSNINNMSNGHIKNLVQIFLKDRKDVKVEPGRKGGVWKGGKPERIDNRPRCMTCNQVVRQKADSNIITSETIH